MCIVAWLPYQNGYHVFSNRDDRPAKAHLSNHRQQGNDLIILLNGGFKKHRSTPPYRASRVEVLQTYFDFLGADDFYHNFVFEGMEAFTLVIFQHQQLQQLVWTGTEVRRQQLDVHQLHLWASSTLYTEKERLQFRSLVEQQRQDPAEVSQLFKHTFKYPGNAYGTVTLSTVHFELQ